MKRTIALCLTLLCMVLCVGCGKEKAAVPVNKLDWSLTEGENEGHGYMYFQLTNNTKTPIQSFQMTFRIKDDISLQKREQFLRDLQASQGFDDAFMQTFLSNLEQNGGEPVMTATGAEILQPGQSAEPTLCYYMGGWTSKDLLYGELFEPKTLTVTYEKDGALYQQAYDFKSETYTTQPAQQPQQ